MNTMILGRGLAGIGGGGLAALNGITVGDMFPPRERGRWIAATLGVFGLASVVGPPLGGLVTDLFGWRWIFGVGLLLPVGATILIVPAMPPSRRLTSVSIDWAGIALFCAAMTALLLMVSLGGRQYPWLSPQILACAAAGVAAAAVLIWHEGRATEPLIPLWMFGGRLFTTALLASFLFGVVMYGVVAYLPLYLQVVRGQSAGASGLQLVPLMLPFIVGGLGAGQLMHRTGRYKELLVVAALLITVCLTLLALGPRATQAALLPVTLAGIGAGLGAAFPMLGIVIQSAFPYRMMGTANSLRQLATNLSSAIGIPALGLLAFFATSGSSLGSSAVRAGLAVGLEHVFGAISLLSAAALLLALTLPVIPLRDTFESGPAPDSEVRIPPGLPPADRRPG
jgi:MFS family permease